MQIKISNKTEIITNLYSVRLEFNGIELEENIFVRVNSDENFEEKVWKTISAELSKAAEIDLFKVTGRMPKDW